VKRRTALRLAGASASLALVRALPARSQTLTAVKVGASLDDGLWPLLYAMHAGIFKDAGLDIQLQSLSNGAVLATAVAGGVVEIGKSSLMVLINAYARGVHFKLIAGAAMHTPSEVSDQIIVLKESPITSLAQANGKTVAVNVLQSLEHFGLESLIDKAGGDSTSVKYIEMPFSAMFPALEQGRVDIATLGNPSLTVAIQSGKIRSLGVPYNGIANRFLIAGWFGSQQWVTANRSICTRFGQAMRQATIYTNDHHQEIVPIVAEYSKIDPDVLRKMNSLTNATSLDPKEIQPPIDAAVKYKLIPQGFPASDLLV
jgi:NitT/TauT family transport system substrate-binding protein